MSAAVVGTKVGLLVGLLASSGCAADDAAMPSVSLIERGASALTAGSVTALNGTYSSCVDRSGSWSVRVSGAAPLANAPLSVVKGDAACSLTVTEVVADQTYGTSTPLGLSASYLASASSFTPGGGGPASFFANAKLDAAGFASDFVISMLYSGDPSATDAGNVTATYATVSSSVTATLVPPPDYTISFTVGTPFTLQLDAAKNVTSVSGTATLQDGTSLGTTYVVDQGTLGASPGYLAVQGAFLSGTQRTITGANPTIAASYFGLSGVSLATPVVRTVIVGKLLGGVLGYELIKVTFKSP